MIDNKIVLPKLEIKIKASRHLTHYYKQNYLNL